MAHVVEYLPSKALNSNPSTTKRKKAFTHLAGEEGV
jgi:hypothetical protein